MVKRVGEVGFVVVILLALVGIASVLGRLVLTVQFLSDGSVVNSEGTGIGPEFNERYYAHPYLTLVHIGAGLVSMTLGPLQFVAAIRKRWLRVHRWCGRVYLVASLVGVVSALAFVPMLPVFGTFTAKVAVVFVGGLFLVSIVKAYRHIRRFEIAQHREWMIRAFAIGLGISTFRVLLPILMGPVFGASFPEAWDTVVWLGFAINLVVAEVWINVTRGASVVPGRVGVAEGT